MAVHDKQAKLQQLIALLNNSSGLTMNEITTKLQTTRQSVITYFHELPALGYELRKRQEGKKVFYHLDLISDSSSSYLNATKDFVRKYLILRELDEQPLTNKKLWERFSQNSDPSSSLCVGNTRFRQLVNELVEEGDLILCDKMYHPSGKNYPFTYQMELDRLFSLQMQLQSLSQKHPLHNQYQQIEQKIKTILGELDMDDDTADSYILYGKPYQTRAKLKEGIEHLCRYPYKNKVLQYRFDSKKGEQCIYLSTGMVVYSAEKDTLYIMGTQYDPETVFEPPVYYIIREETILDIQTTEYENTQYMSAGYMDIYDSMFSISTDPANEVEIHFDFQIHTKEKLEKLVKNRTHAALTHSGETLIYTDTVRDFADFFRYLRQYGDSYTIVKPTYLIKLAKKSAERALMRYLPDEKGGKKP